MSKNYVPSEKEEYMNFNQLEYFKDQLLKWKDELMKEDQDIVDHIKEEKLDEPDVADNASIEIDIVVESQVQDSHGKLIEKIDNSLAQIENNTYGYCVKCGNPVGLKRLKARPVANLCIEGQECHEREKDIAAMATKSRK
ncbi:MAG: RNA polymerase-binding protein DksA [Rickettsiales bacterium]|nr:RNA polymerase-binding protein DksA [Rickettsiales bacterium]